MSRAKDGSIVKESQKPLYRVKKIGLILAVALAVVIGYSLATRKDPDAARVNEIRKTQLKMAMSQDLAPLRKRMGELERVSNSRKLSDAELKELGELVQKTGEVKRELKDKYALSGEKERGRGPVQKKILWVKLKEITAPAAGWSKDQQTPSGKFKIMPFEGKVEVLFSNGAFHVLDPTEQIDMGYVSASYKLRGAGGKDVPVAIYIAKAI